jgi:hypothetical protein
MTSPGDRSGPDRTIVRARRTGSARLSPTGVIADRITRFSPGVSDRISSTRA